jgi:hypothetical protein
MSRRNMQTEEHQGNQPSLTAVETISLKDSGSGKEEGLLHAVSKMHDSIRW